MRSCNFFKFCPFLVIRLEALESLLLVKTCIIILKMKNRVLTTKKV